MIGATASIVTRGNVCVCIAKSTAEKLAKLSESAGTPFTAEEYLKSVAESSEEMSTEGLRSVAGASFALAERLSGYI
jgi:hypothetical protein